MNAVKAILAVFAVAMVSGCFSLQTAKLSRSGDENIFISNYGWYLFDCLPLATGNADESTKLPTVFFRDDVTMDKMQQRMLSYAEKNGKEIYDPAYHNHNSILFNVPGLNFPLPIPYILTYREIQLSGVLK